MENVEMTVKGNELIIKIDLSKRLGKSSSGKSTIIATTAGNKAIEGKDGLFIGLNCYTKE